MQYTTQHRTIILIIFPLVFHISSLLRRSLLEGRENFDLWIVNVNTTLRRQHRDVPYLCSSLSSYTGWSRPCRSSSDNLVGSILTSGNIHADRCCIDHLLHRPASETECYLAGNHTLK